MKTARAKRSSQASPPVDLDAERSRLIDREQDARGWVLAAVGVVATYGEDDDAEMLRHPLEMLRKAWTAYREASDARYEFERRVRS